MRASHSWRRMAMGQAARYIVDVVEAPQRLTDDAKKLTFQSSNDSLSSITGSEIDA